MSGLRLFLLGAPYLERNGTSLGLWSAQMGSRKALAILSYLGVTGQGHRRQSLATLLWPEADGADARLALNQSLDVLQEALGPGVLDVDRETVALVCQAGEPGGLWLDTVHFGRVLEARGAHGHPLDEVCPECMPLLSEAVDLYRGDFMAGVDLPDSPAFEEWRLSEQDALRRKVIRALDHLVRGHSTRAEFETAMAYARRGLQLAPFINREQALAEIERLLLGDPPCRLLCLLGPDGVGKTRLAAEIAEQVGGGYADGVHVASLADASATFLDAASAGDPTGLLTTAIAEALGLSFRDGQEPRAQLLDYLRAKNLLLVLDGIDTPHSTKFFLATAGLVADIQRAAPKVATLVTSRRPLGLDEERVWTVGGLGYSEADAAPADKASADEALPDEASGDDSAVRLFLESVHRLTPSYPLSEADRRAAVRICQLVEGMPLGLELASAWARAMSLAEIAADIERNLASLSALHDVPPGHRTLRAVLERSWALLSEDEQRTVAKLSVFRGAFTQAAAQRVAGASPFLLMALARTALVRPRHAERYELHELVRQFVADKLRELPIAEREARDAHCAYYTAFVHEREERLRGAEQRAAGTEIVSEIGNVRAAWRWAVEGRKTIKIEQSMDALYLFYYARGWIQQGQAAFNSAVSALQSAALQGSAKHGERDVCTQEDEYLLGRLLARQARFSHRLGQYECARDLLRQSSAAFDRVEGAGRDRESAHVVPHQERAFGLFALSAVLRAVGEAAQAREYLREGLTLYRECGDRAGMAMTLKLLGIVCASLGEIPAAQQRLQEALTIYKEIVDPYGTANTLNDLSIVAARQGKLPEAQRLNQECLGIRRQIDDRWGVGTALNNLGYMAYLGQAYAEAVEYLSEGLAIQREIGDRYHIANCLSNLGAAAHALGERKEALASLYEALGIAYEIGARPLVLEVSAEIGALLAEDDAQDGEQATELLTFVHDHPQTDKWTAERAAQGLDQLAARLAPETWAAAQERGRSGTLETVVPSLLRQDRAAHQNRAA